MADVTGRNKVALVTGANKGIGYEVAGQLGRLGFAVGVGSRDPGRGRDAVARLAADGVDAFEVPLDVTDDASVAAAADLLTRGGRLDVLVNNAGVVGGWPQDPTTMGPSVLHAAVETNVVGVVRVTNALLRGALLRRGPSPRIVNVSTHVSSLALQTDPTSDLGPGTGAYAPSKTFLNAVTVQYAHALAGTGVVVNCACPGYVQTDLNGGDGAVTAEQGARVVVQVALLPDGSPSGQLLDENGVVPW